jgi:hypothetical protein
MMELYDVRTAARKLGGYKNVEFFWFVLEKTARRPYADLIENYNQSGNCQRRYLAEECIDSMFTLDQANALKEYLDRNHPSLGTATIKKARLPIPNNSALVFLAVGTGRYEGFYRLEEDPNYSLPFKADGYFDLRDCEPADESETGEPADDSECPI